MMIYDKALASNINGKKANCMSSITTKNARILKFFQDRPALEFDATILKFIDIIENLTENMNNSMNNTIAFQLLENMKTVQRQMLTMQTTVEKIQSDTQTQFSLKMNEFKRDYISEMKMILTCNVSEKIEPLLKEQNLLVVERTTNLLNSIVPKNDQAISKSMETLVKQMQVSLQADSKDLIAKAVDAETLDKNLDEFEKKITTTILSMQKHFNSAIEATEKRLDSRMSSINEISTTNNALTCSLNTSMGELVNKFSNSNLKGKMSENILMNQLTEIYPYAILSNVSQTKESCDFLMERQDRVALFIENKNWESTVPQGEVDKFLRDISDKGCNGLFISQRTGIANKNRSKFEIEIFKGSVLVYLSMVFYDMEKIQVAINIIDYVKTIYNTFEAKNNQGEDLDMESVSREIIEHINKDYEVFVSDKLKIIETMKRNHEEVMMKLNTLNFPYLDAFLKSFTYLKMVKQTNDKIVCECGRDFKTNGALKNHMRSCKKKPCLEIATE